MEEELNPPVAINEPYVELIMPSEGDMQVVSQENGKLVLKPIFYGGDCNGPTIKYGDYAFRIKFKTNFKVDMKRSDASIQL